MSSEKAYDPNTKRLAMGLWLALSAGMLGAMLLPLYWFWDRIAAKPLLLVLVLGLLGWAMFTWGKLVITMAKGSAQSSQQ
jgi:hypothetical protein